MVNKVQRGLQDSQDCRERLGPKAKRGILVLGCPVLLGLLGLQDELQLWRDLALTTLTVMRRLFEAGLDPPAPPAFLDLLDPLQSLWSPGPLAETDRRENLGSREQMEKMGSLDLLERWDRRVIQV